MQNEITPHVPQATCKGEEKVQRTQLGGMQTPKLRCHSHTQTGRRGGVNQDAVMIRPPFFFAVADGVGGGVHGEVASRAALDYCGAVSAEKMEELAKELHDLDQAVAGAVAELSLERGGTTLAALWLGQRRGLIGHSGDSRVWRMRRSLTGRWRFERLTIDHTYKNLDIPPPENGSPNDPCLMLGFDLDDAVALQEIKVNSGDVFLLASDGLHRFVSDRGISKVIERGLEQDWSFEKIAQRLVERAVNNNSHDDISIVLVSPQYGLHWHFQAALAASIGLFLWVKRAGLAAVAEDIITSLGGF